MSPQAESNSCANLEDEALIRAIQAGRHEAFDDLMRRYDRLVRFAIFRTHRQTAQADPAWTDTIATDVWMSLHRGFETSDVIPSNLRSYLIQVARFKTLDAMRSRSRQTRRIDFDTTVPADCAIDESSALEWLAELEDLERLRATIPRLSDRDRAILGQMELIMERKWSLAAQNLGLPESTLRSTWPRLLERIRSLLEKRAPSLAPRPLDSDS